MLPMRHARFDYFAMLLLIRAAIFCQRGADAMPFSDYDAFCCFDIMLRCTLRD